MELPNGDTYTMFKQGERRVAGCISPENKDNIPPMWLNYILVEDLDTYVAKATGLGASIIMDRVDLPMGSFAVIADPQGAVFAFWQASGEEG
jgi:predicted enzyme related to lactoylglutathione lyase